MDALLLKEKAGDSGEKLSNRGLYIASAIVGGTYGITLRVMASLHYDLFRVMTVGFIFFMPFALGCIAVYIAEIKRPQRPWTWIWLPWLSLLAALGGITVTLLEGTICIAMFLPIGMILATLGGLMGGVAARFVRSRKAQSLTMACILVLPFVTGPWEKQVFYEWESRRVENVIDIQAPAEVVWRNIKRVPAIRKDELPSSWAHAIGLPDPIEATLSYEGVGGVRLHLRETLYLLRPLMRGSRSSGLPLPSQLMPTRFRPLRWMNTCELAGRILMSCAENTAWRRSQKM
jgi:hypothetical protein